MLLTPTTKQPYYLAQVLTTLLKRKRQSAPESMRFFYVQSFFWSGVRGIQYPKGESLRLSYARLLTPGRLHFACGQLHNKERKKMSAKPRASRRRKPNPSVVASILFLSPERRKAETQYRWETALRLYLSSLNHDETNIVDEILAFLHKKPSFLETYLPSNVIPLFQSPTKQEKQEVSK